MLGFEIGQRESGFIANRQTESQNHGITEPSSTVLLYRYMELRNMGALGVNAAIMRVIGKLEQMKNSRNRNCAHWGGAYHGVLL